MRRLADNLSLLVVATLCAALFALGACNGDEQNNGDGSDQDAGDITDTGGADADTSGNDAGDTESEEGATYHAIATEIYSSDFTSSTSLVAVVPSLDVEEINLDNAREFSGRATITSVGDWLFVADGEEPVVHRFEVGNDGSLTEAGRLSFANYGLTTWSIDSWGNTVISPTKAYMFNSTDGSHIVWNPTDMEITGEIETSGLVHDTLTLQAGPGILRGDHMFRMYTWYDWEAFDWSTEPQQLGIYDTENDELVELVETTGCPALYSKPEMNADGDIYFSNHVWSPMEHLVLEGPESCAMRIPDGQQEFESGFSLTYADITEGREGAVLRHIGDNKALLDVFHDERATIDSETDPAELGRSANWRLWMIDLQAETGAPVDGLDFKPGGYNDVEVDERTLVLLPAADYSQTTAYEISTDGTATEAFKIEGSAYHMATIETGSGQ